MSYAISSLEDSHTRPLNSFYSVYNSKLKNEHAGSCHISNSSPAAIHHKAGSSRSYNNRNISMDCVAPDVWRSDVAMKLSKSERCAQNFQHYVLSMALTPFLPPFFPKISTQHMEEKFLTL